MTKEFVPYDRALKLKELGFDESCFGFYYDDGELKIKEGNISRLGYINAPTFQQAFRWFREEYNLHSEIRSYTAKFFTPVIQKLESIVTYIEYGGVSYEEAELACLDKLIEIVESKNK